MHQGAISLGMLYDYNHVHYMTLYDVVHNSYLPVIGMHDRMHPNYWQITILLVVDLCSSLAYFMTQPLPIAGKLPIKTLVAKQLHVHVHVCVHWDILVIDPFILCFTGSM